MNVIGTCSLCGGAVCTPELWGGVLPPQPTCSRCGAVAANHGPIIRMRRVDKPHGPYVGSGKGTEKQLFPDPPGRPVYATAENTPSVRKGYEMGGYLLGYDRSEQQKEYQ